MPTWNGNTNGDFLTGTNWDGNVAPAPGSAVVLDDGGLANQPTLGFSDASTVDTVSISEGTLTIDGDLSATTGVTVTSGLLQIGVSGSISGDVDVGNTGSFVVDGTLTGNLTSSGGTTLINAANTINGAVSLSGGLVDMETFGDTLDIDDLTVNGGILKLDNAILSADSLSGGGGTIQLTTANGQSVLFFGSDNSSTSFAGGVTTDTVLAQLVKEGFGTTSMSGVISGGGALFVTAGTLSLSGVNTFAGISLVSGGTLALTGAGSIANSEVVQLEAAGVFDISGTNTGTTVKSVFASSGESGTVNMGGKALNVTGQLEALNNLTFNGAAGTDALTIALGASLAHFSLSIDSFTNWTNGVDTITVAGNALGNTITGSRNMNINGGAGNDTIVNTFVELGTWNGGADVDTLDTSADFFGNAVYDLSAASFGIFGATFSNFENVIDNNGGNTLTGNAVGNTLRGNGGADILNGGLGNDTLEGGAGADAIDGGGGLGDYAEYQSSDTGVTVGINAGGTASGGHATGDTLTNIENLTGSAFADTLIGSTGINTLRGGGGADNINASNNNDTLFGEAGDDLLAGGVGADLIDGGANDAGGDTATYSNHTGLTGMTINLATGVAIGNGHGAGDTLVNIENAVGSAQNDTITGDGNANVLTAGNGLDTLNGGAGADTLNGQNGDDIFVGGAGADANNGGGGLHDKVDYSLSALGVWVDLRPGGIGIAILGDSFGDTWTGIEDVTGSASSDNMFGSPAANILLGGLSDDTLYGSAGADTMNGGGGTSDTANYSQSSGAVSIDLLAFTASGGHAAGDTIINIENLIGSDFGDTLSGNNLVNDIFGGGGNDTINGNGNGDNLNGGAGDDTLNGGSGADTFTFQAAWEDDTINGWQNGADKIQAVGAGALTHADFTETQDGFDTLLTLTADPTKTIRLTNILATTIDQTDFV